MNIDLTEIDNLLRTLFPLNRSLAGSSNRQTLSILQKIIPLTIIEYPSGTPVYDWNVPPEWNLNEGWIKDALGQVLIHTRDTNLHVPSYSQPIHTKTDFLSLSNHLHYSDKLPEAIPYRTLYYNNTWGFSLSKPQLQKLKNARSPLEIYIDSSFDHTGSLSAGELLIPGESEHEILISTYICHPSLANDNLSGIILATLLARQVLLQDRRKYSYRFIWVPETIGAIAYCAMNEMAMKRISVGLVVTTVGGPGRFGYKQTFNEDHILNHIIDDVLSSRDPAYQVYPFDIHGSDERQYSSQAFRINCASITKDKYYEYPEYHTSLDNLDLVTPSAIADSLSVYFQVLTRLEQLPVDVLCANSQPKLPSHSSQSPTFINLYPHCEVMLSKRDLYPKTGGALCPGLSSSDELDLILWLLFLSDGTTSLDMISAKLNKPYSSLLKVASHLESLNILRNKTHV